MTLLTKSDIEIGAWPEGLTPAFGPIFQVQVETLVEHRDDRGMLFEFYSGKSEFWNDDIVWGHCFTVRPGGVKGWGVHLAKTDRYCVISGELLTVLYDSRRASPTFRMFQEVRLGQGGVRMVSIPPGVWHLNVNQTNCEAFTIDLPTATYNHITPDKITVGWDSSQIPYWSSRPELFQELASKNSAT